MFRVQSFSVYFKLFERCNNYFRKTINMWRITLFSALLILLCHGEPADIARLVNDLSQVLDATSNIIFSFEPTPLFATITRNLTLPKIIITRNITYEVRMTFDTQILSVVLLEDTPSLDFRWHSIVFSTLRRLHHIDVLFYWPREITAATEIWLELFTLYWQHGFSNLLAVDVDGQLLTLEPFPQLRVINTTLQSYISQRNNTWRDLKGHRLRISSAHDPPRTLIYRQPNNGERQFDGAAPQIFAAFAKRYNATIEPVLAPNSADFNIDHVCSERLQARLVDACSDWGVYSAETIVSTPLQLYNCYLVVRYAPPLSKLYYFQVPFQAAVWRAIGASICLVTLITALLTRLQRGEWHFGRLGLDAWASFLYLPFDLRSMGTRLRSLIFVTLCVSGFMLSNMYLGYLSSILGKSVYEPQIKTLEDFERSNLTVMAHEYQNFVFRKYGVPPIVAERLHIVSYEEFLVHRNNFDTRYAYMNPEITQELFAYQQKFLRRPFMQKLEKPIIFVLAGHALKEGWPLEELFNKHSLEMYAAGHYKRLKEEANLKTISLGYVNYARMERTGVRPLGLEYIAMPALLLGCGYGLSFMVLLLELLFAKMKKHRENTLKSLSN
ncbi:uncharacterized protein LOC105217343 [Zeugodacus cucurbitae]|uniref:uncharacterized protein LOC105217343 n=1 Tax=Zeugodacus cucurbitae TaxID=28588 RepID=UPI0023D95EBF|nr:uncharacterized protein LOC105217343 [Zeugodacus cucurbitae]